MNLSPDDAAGLLAYLEKATRDGVGHGFKDTDCPICRVLETLRTRPRAVSALADKPEPKPEGRRP